VSVMKTGGKPGKVHGLVKKLQKAVDRVGGVT
jgi:hypothetical protein